MLLDVLGVASRQQLTVRSMNKYLVRNMPLIGQETPEDPRLLYHSGSFCGYMISAILMTETVVVLVDTLARSDAADWVAKLLLEATLNKGEVKTNYVALAKEVAQSTENGFPRVHKELSEGRIPGTLPLSLEGWGRYDNLVHTFFIDIFLQDGSLFMTLNDESHRYKWKLEHYHYNMWSWMIRYKDALEQTFWPESDKDLYLFEFKASNGSRIDQLSWRHDPGVPKGEHFKKRALESNDNAAKAENSIGKWKSELYRVDLGSYYFLNAGPSPCDVSSIVAFLFSLSWTYSLGRILIPL